MESTKMQRRTILGMLAATPVVVAACSDNDTGGDGAGAQVAADVVPQMVPLSALKDADPGEVHLAYAPAVPPPAQRSE
ncbi:MAG: hypothetical protein WAX12_11725, partial [Candidatus Microthrix subdominans]|nr:hypothetical protein [Candidatus Microthrix sp.]